MSVGAVAGAGAECYVSNATRSVCVCRLHKSLYCIRDPEAVFRALQNGKAFPAQEVQRVVGYVRARVRALLDQNIHVWLVADGAADASKAAAIAERNR